MEWDINFFRAMKQKSLMHKSLMQFTVFVIILMFVSIPLFYWLTKSFYAEEMIDVIDAVKAGKEIPVSDLENDIMQGVMIQFALITVIFGIAIILMIHFVSHRLWMPFDRTLKTVELFNIENCKRPVLERSDVKEFDRMNTVLERMMDANINSYKAQKEFTENASHELQTPLAVFQSKLDLLLQQPDLTENQAVIIQELYNINGRLSKLNRNLLLIAKLDNNQFKLEEKVDIVEILNENIPHLKNIASGLTIEEHYTVATLPLNANGSLLESLIGNLFVNAVRHNRPYGKIIITLTSDSLSIANTSNERELDGTQIFNRFYRIKRNENGNGLGLAIVKAICDYHSWRVSYLFHNGVHEFKVFFK